MAVDIDKYAQTLYDNLSGWQDRTLERIGKRIKETGRLSAYDQQALKNIQNITGDMNAIYDDLARVTGQNIAEVKTAFEKFMDDNMAQYKPLYDFRNMQFVPFSENAYAQRLVQHWVEQTAGEMINLSRTKALSVVKYGLRNGERVPIGTESLQGAYQSAIDKAVFNVTQGVGDFYSNMRDTITDFGGSGIRIDYGNGVTRSIDSVIRQNMKFAVKEMQADYDKQVSEELGCDGFEVNFSATCRPSHAFMEGQMFSYNGDKTIDGVTYPDGSEALAALDDYGCNHRKMGVILGISEPRYNKAEIAEKNRKTSEMIEYNGKIKSRYEWIQKQREIERTIRTEKTTANMAKSAGDTQLQKDCNARIKALKEQYKDLTDKVGLQATPERMSIVKSTNTGKSTVEMPKQEIKKIEFSEQYKELKQIAETNKIEYNRCEIYGKPLDDDKIISKIGGGDMTQGSCCSLAYTYAGNKAGLDVTDFRGGNSRWMFSLDQNAKKIINLPNVQGDFIEEFNDFKAANQLLSEMAGNKEYILGTGSHTAVVRKIEEKYQYLELQSATNNGWKDLDDTILKRRFACKTSHKVLGTKTQMPSYLIDVESLGKSEDFKELLGYINTEVSKQKKGATGFAK